MEKRKKERIRLRKRRRRKEADVRGKKMRDEEDRGRVGEESGTCVRTYVRTYVTQRRARGTVGTNQSDTSGTVCTNWGDTRGIRTYDSAQTKAAEAAQSVQRTCPRLQTGTNEAHVDTRGAWTSVRKRSGDGGEKTIGAWRTKLGCREKVLNDQETGERGDVRTYVRTYVRTLLWQDQPGWTNWLTGA